LDYRRVLLVGAAAVLSAIDAHAVPATEMN